MHVEHNDTIKTMSDTVLRKIYRSLYLKGCMWEGVGDWTELQHIDPHSIGHNHVSFPFSCAAQPGAWGPTLLGAGFLYRILSPTSLVSKLTDFLSSPSYIIVQRPLLLVGVTIALIQPIHGQGYNSDIPPPDAPVIYMGAFPILTARPGHRSIFNNWSLIIRWFIVIFRTLRGGCLTSLQRCSWCILQLQPIGLAGLIQCTKRIYSVSEEYWK